MENKFGRVEIVFHIKKLLNIRVFSTGKHFYTVFTHNLFETVNRTSGRITYIYIYIYIYRGGGNSYKNNRGLSA